MADKFKIAGSNTGDYYQIVNGKRQYFKKDGTPIEESVFLQNNNAQIAKDGSMRKKQNVAKDGLVKQYYPGSKTGRYFTVDKNGKKRFYAANGTEIKEAYFNQKEQEAVEAAKAKKSGKKSAKAQPQKEEMGLLEGMWESAKGAVKGAAKFAKGIVTDDKGNFSLTGGAKKVWRQTKKLFSNGIGEVANAAWEGIKNAGKKMVKGMFADLFPHFFRPTDGSAASSMMEVMNNQIRALTGGDVTKESEILAIDTWRALTELDAKAREAEEFNRKMKKK